MPHTAWPLVQPLPNLVPIPTKNPETIKPIKLILDSSYS
jgi:hypothetical protein